MDSTSRIERELLDLPPGERVRLVLKAWESLSDAQDVAASPDFDPEGLRLARQRQEQLDQGMVRPLTEREFRRRTSGT